MRFLFFCENRLQEGEERKLRNHQASIPHCDPNVAKTRKMSSFFFVNRCRLASTLKRLEWIGSLTGSSTVGGKMTGVVKKEIILNYFFIFYFLVSVSV